MGAQGGVNILLLEDHPDIAALLKAYLERRGHRVALAGTRQEALAHPELARMDVLICDLGLPDGSGSRPFAGVTRPGRPGIRGGDHGPSAS